MNIEWEPPVVTGSEDVEVAVEEWKVEAKVDGHTFVWVELYMCDDDIMLESQTCQILITDLKGSPYGFTSGQKFTLRLLIKTEDGESVLTSAH